MAEEIVTHEHDKIICHAHILCSLYKQWSEVSNEVYYVFLAQVVLELQGIEFENANFLLTY